MSVGAVRPRLRAAISPACIPPNPCHSRPLLPPRRDALSQLPQRFQSCFLNPQTKRPSVASAPGRATRPLCPRRGELAHNFIVQCRKSQRPGCMADTTGPMPLIRWREEGKRRLGLGFTSLWTKPAAVSVKARIPRDHRVEIGHWRVFWPHTRAHAGLARWPCAAHRGEVDVGSGSGRAKIFLLRGSVPGSRAFRLDDACGVEARDLGFTAAELAQHLGRVLTQKWRR